MGDDRRDAGVLLVYPKLLDLFLCISFEAHWRDDLVKIWIPSQSTSCRRAAHCPRRSDDIWRPTEGRWFIFAYHNHWNDWNYWNVLERFQRGLFESFQWFQSFQAFRPVT